MYCIESRGGEVCVWGGGGGGRGAIRCGVGIYKISIIFTMKSLYALMGYKDPVDYLILSWVITQDKTDRTIILL